MAFKRWLTICFFCVYNESDFTIPVKNNLKKYFKKPCNLKIRVYYNRCKARQATTLQELKKFKLRVDALLV